MILKTVRLRNIRSFTDETIHFPEGSVLLSGDIGSGKTSILLAVEFALFGTRRNELSGESLLRNGKTEGYVELSFLIDGKEYLIKRSLKRSKDEVKQTAGYILEGSLRKDGTAIELKSMMLSILGYPSELLSKSKDLIFRYTVYTPQEEMKKILFETREARIDTLRKVFGVDKYKRIRENALVYSKELKSHKKVLEAQISDIDDKRSHLSSIMNEIKELEFREKLIMPEHEATKLKVQDARSKIFEHEKKRDDYLDAKKESELLDVRLRNFVLQREQNIKEAELLSKQIVDAEKELSLLKLPDKDELAQRSSELNVELLHIEDHLRNINRKVSIASTKKHQSHDILNTITRLDTCPVCRQKVNESYKGEINARESNNILVLDSEIKSMQTEENLLNERLASIKKLMEKVREDERKFSVLIYQQKALAEKKQRHANLEQSVKQMKSEIGMINEKKLILKGQLSTLFGSEDLYKKLRVEYDQLVDEERKKAISLAEIRRERETLGRSLALLQNELARKEEIKEEIKHLAILLGYIESHFINLMATIEKHVMINIHHEFDEFFKQWFSLLLESETLNARIDDEFTPIAEQNGYETDISFLSGGEKTSLALAYRLSLNKVINDLISRIKTRNLIILDEPTDGFSSEQLDKVRDVLFELDANQIIIVSHESKIESFVDSIIRIAKEDHVSRVVQA